MISKTIRFSPSAAFSIALLIILSGCAGSDLKTRSLSQLPKTNSFTCADRAITGSYTILDAKACKTYLGRDVRAKGYQPIYITVTNNSDREIFFTHKNISMPTIPAYEIAKKLHASTAAFALGLGIPGAIGATGVVGMALLAGASLAALGGGNHAGGCMPIFALVLAACLTPAIICSSYSIKTNRNRDANIHSKSLVDQSINPQSTISGLVFVSKKDFNSNFEIMLTDAANQKLVLATHN